LAWQAWHGTGPGTDGSCDDKQIQVGIYHRSDCTWQLITDGSTTWRNLLKAWMYDDNAGVHAVLTELAVSISRVDFWRPEFCHTGQGVVCAEWWRKRWEGGPELKAVNVIQ
jgi:hypothetical protein